MPEQLDFEIDKLEPNLKTTLSKHKEDVRKYLAYALVGIFAVEAIFSCLAAFYGSTSESLRTVLQIVVSPTVALAGSAMGYYFGSSSK